MTATPTRWRPRRCCTGTGREAPSHHHRLSRITRLRVPLRPAQARGGDEIGGHTVSHLEVPTPPRRRPPDLQRAAHPPQLRITPNPLRPPRHGPPPANPRRT